MGQVLEFRRPPERIDVIVVYYNHLVYWAECVRGLKVNAERIRKVYVVTDGPFDLDALASMQDEVVKQGFEPTDFEWIDFDKKLVHGAGRGLNEAQRKACTKYVLQTTARQRLEPGYVAKLLSHAKPQAMVLAPIHNISPWPDGPVVKMDYQLESLDWAINADRVWKCARNGGTLLDREFSLQLGGYEEQFGEIGYGLEDYEFALRWLYAGGTISWEVETYSVQEIDRRPVAERTEKHVKPEIFHLLNPAGVQYYNGRLRMFASPEAADLTAFNVGQTGMIDSWADCTSPEKWLAPRSLRDCFVYGPDRYMPPEEWADWLLALAPKFAPGGHLVIVAQDARAWEPLVEAAGLVVARAGQNILEAYSSAEVEE